MRRAFFFKLLLCVFYTGNFAFSQESKSKVETKKEVSSLENDGNSEEAEISIQEGNSIKGQKLSLAEFLKAMEEFYEQSDARLLLKRSNKTAELTEKLQTAFDPWKVSNSTKIGTANYYTKFNNLQNTTNLSYESPKGISVDTYAKVTEPIGESSGLQPSDSFGTSLNYEFNKTPEQYAFTETIASTQKTATKLQIAGSYVEQQENFIINSVTLYVQYCKLADKKSLEELVLQTLKIADAQQAAKSIDIQDYLRIRDLYLSFQREIQSLEDSILQSERSLTSVSASSTGYLKNLQKKSLDCEMMLTEGKSIKALDEKQYEPIIKNNSEIAGLRKKLDLVRLQEGSYINSAKSSMQWTTGIDVTGIRIPSDRTENLYIGFNYSYSIPEKLNKLKKLNFGRDIQDLTIQMKLSEDSLRSKISQLTQSVKSLAGVAEIVRQTHQNSIKSLKVLKIRQDLGIINANNVYSAYSNYAASLSSIRDLWQNYKTSMIKLDNLEKNAKASNSIQNSSPRGEDDL